MTLNDIISTIEAGLQDINPIWDGRKCILELKEVDYQWKQMEWIGFYFQYVCETKLNEKGFEVSGKKYGNVEFDFYKEINWDAKSHAIKANDHKTILNDEEAINQSIQKYGEHGIIMALLDVEYNDDEEPFRSGMET